MDTAGESNTEKHINFPEVEEESAENLAIGKTTSDRQKQWQNEIWEVKKKKDVLLKRRAVQQCQGMKTIPWCSMTILKSHTINSTN
ncbi:MAG TPA: hypothetical protein VNT20_13310 [Flavisolibacter sp.]|nr:hypothetical protein [Flavisolibacter sp.]